MVSSEVSGMASQQEDLFTRRRTNGISLQTILLA
jgi:hypothetical protein